MLSEYRGYSEKMEPSKETRSPEEMQADDKISKLIDMDDQMRQTQDIDSPRLMYNMGALIALKGYILGSKHADKHPKHADKLKDYAKIIDSDLSHLKQHIKG
jgi:hypothetical protein